MLMNQCRLQMNVSYAHWKTSLIEHSKSTQLRESSEPINTASCLCDMTCCDCDSILNYGQSWFKMNNNEILCSCSSSVFRSPARPLCNWKFLKVLIKYNKILVKKMNWMMVNMMNVTRVYGYKIKEIQKNANQTLAFRKKLAEKKEIATIFF